MKKCPFCGAELKDDSLFCTECGKELPKAIECPHCGAPVNEGDVFCTECGKRIDEVPQATSSEPTKPKCPHCDAFINEGDVFCMECGRKLDEPQPTEAVEVVAPKESVEETPSKIVDTPQTEEKDIETPQAEEETKDFNYSYVEEEPKTWRDYKLPIFGGIFIVFFLGACWWYYSSSSIRAAREKVVADSLEMVRIDSVKKAQAKIEAETEATEKEQQIASCKAFLEKFYEKGQDENYIRQNVTKNALQFLKDEYDYECEDGDCLATWIFEYEGGSDYGAFKKRTIDVIDENTYIVGNHYTTEDGKDFLYSVRLGIVKQGNFYKIDTIEKEFEGLYEEAEE